LKTLFIIDETDIHDNPLGYTAHTLDIIRPQYPVGTVFFILIGGDSLANFHTWHHPEAILNAANLVFSDRGLTQTPENLPPPMQAFWRACYTDVSALTQEPIHSSNAHPSLNHDLSKENSTIVPSCGTISRLSIALSPISATHIRQTLALQANLGGRFCDDIRAEVLDYINENDLYL
jgi:nicotinic acid mononucleotide adenylyltransferase